MGPDLTSKRWIVAKGGLFALLALLAGAQVVFIELATWQRGLLLAICVWAACRFYYFLFHVLHAYVDPSLPCAGVTDLVLHLLAKRRRPRDTKGESDSSPTPPRPRHSGGNDSPEWRA